MVQPAPASPRLRIAVVGTGGIGGVFAACLTRAGHEVTAITGNAAVAEAIARDGFVVDEVDGTRWVVPAGRPPRVRVERGDRFDLAVLCTKATTLERAVGEVASALGRDGRVVTCQNGLPEAVAARVVGAERVVGCVVGFGATMIAPGVYQRTSRGGLQLGPSENGAALIARALGAVAPARVVGSLEGVRWSKLALNCVTSTLGALGGERLGVLLARRFVRRLALEIFTEVAAVARRSGVTMALVGGTLDVASLALTPAEQALRRGSPALVWKHAVLLAVGMKYRRLRSSSLVALERGRRPETEWLNGEVVRRGRSVGLDAVVNERLVEAVEELVSGRERPSLDYLRRVYESLADRRGPRRVARAA